MDRFIKFQRMEDSEELQHLISNDHCSLVLLIVIANRARRCRAPNPINGTNQFQAFIGDHKSCGLSERNYRTAKKHLEKFGLATFRPTPRGTIATLCNGRVFDINPEGSDEQHDRQATDRRRTDDGRATTKKNVKNDHNEKMKEVGEGEYPRLLSVFEKDLTIANGIAALRAGHPAFIKTADIHLENAFKDQVDRSKWYEAVKGLIKAYAPPAELPRPNHTLSNWLAGKPSEKNASRSDPVGKRLKLDF